MEDRVRMVVNHLTRPHAADGGEPRHFLQVNNMHLHDNSTWQLG